MFREPKRFCHDDKWAEKFVLLQGSTRDMNWINLKAFLLLLKSVIRIFSSYTFKLKRQLSLRVDERDAVVSLGKSY